MRLPWQVQLLSSHPRTSLKPNEVPAEEFLQPGSVLVCSSTTHLLIKQPLMVAETVGFTSVKQKVQPKLPLLLSFKRRCGCFNYKVRPNVFAFGVAGVSGLQRQNHTNTTESAKFSQDGSHASQEFLLQQRSNQRQ